ncbi:FemAB family protein [mine drainage metagenome]|uniref:FemAB family protein n=1 Tax=mine drainage metagenome TaxID=410659 RepID=A0A1J5SGT4_9ZZZZ
MMGEAQAAAVAPWNEPLAIKQLTAVDLARWDRFVAACPEATFFHHAGWKEIIEQVFHHRACFLYAERGGEICGVLPLAQVNSWLFGNSLASLPFCVYGGVVATDVEVQGALEAEAERLAQKCGADFLEFRNRAQKHADWPQQDLYVTFRKEIMSVAEDNMLAIPRKQRAMVRKGIKAGLKSEIDTDVERFFVLYADNAHRHGTPALPKRYFERLKAVFTADCEVMIVVDAQGQAVSGVMSFYFRDEVLPYYAGDLLAARELAGNDFKYWELMRRAGVRGLKVFDYGRSKRGTGSFDFKRNWGFEPRPLHYEYRLYRGDQIPQNNPNNPKFRLFIEAWRCLPKGVVNWLGPFIVRNLG